MGWSIGFDSNWGRDVGYGVPAVCDHPDCNEKIDRGLGHVCGGNPYGEPDGCGLFFCGKHLGWSPQLCERCESGEEPFDPKPDAVEWIRWKLTDESWLTWRIDHPDKVAELEAAVEEDAIPF